MILRPIKTNANNVEVSFPMISRRRYGVPYGGPFDEEAFRLALALQGLEEGTGMEVGLVGGEWEAIEDGIVSVSGAMGPVSVEDRDFSASNLFPIRAGEVITLGFAEHGHRTYLVTRQGDGKPPVRLAASDSPTGPIRVITTNRTDARALLSRSHLVTPNINRIGLRLAPVPELAHDLELPSEPQCFGALQITPDGTPIIGGPDGPTIGGYPKAAVVISADRSRLAQLRPGDLIEFEPVTLEEARQIQSDREAEARSLRAQIRLAART